MIPRIVEAKARAGYRIWLRFHDGATGTVDLAAELWGPMFEPLKDEELFAQLTVQAAAPGTPGELPVA